MASIMIPMPAIVSQKNKKSYVTTARTKRDAADEDVIRTTTEVWEILVASQCRRAVASTIYKLSPVLILPFHISLCILLAS